MIKINTPFIIAIIILLTCFLILTIIFQNWKIILIGIITLAISFIIYKIYKIIKKELKDQT